MRLSHREFEQAVAEAVESIPGRFREYLEHIVIDVEDRPSLETARSLGAASRGELLGAYFGTPMTERSVEEGPHLPDRIVIYQRNLESSVRTREELLEQIAVTVMHEIGHHFGLDEDDLEDLGYE